MDIPVKRRLEIKKLIAGKKSMSVTKLSSLFNVSEITIRRDLKKLENEGFLDKVHGGAVIKGLGTEFYPVYLDDIKRNKEQKEKIAREAAKDINDGDAVIIESGTTCLELVYNLGNKKNLVIFTASIPIAYELWKFALNHKDVELNICGGLVEVKSNTLIGSQATSFFQNISADVAFIGAVAVSAERGVIETNSQLDADVTKAIAKNSKKKILLVDSSKFKKSAHIVALPLTSFNKIVTDESLDKDTVADVIKLGIKLVLV